MRAQVRVVLYDAKAPKDQQYTERKDLGFKLPVELPSKLRKSARREFIKNNKGQFWVVGAGLETRTKVVLYVTKGGSKDDRREQGWLGPKRGGAMGKIAPVG